MSASKAEAIVEALQRDTRGTLRVDTHGPGPCRWFRILRTGGAQPIPLYKVWRAAQDATRHSGSYTSEKHIAQAVRLAQQRLPLLSFEEWTQPRKAA